MPHKENHQSPIFPEQQEGLTGGEERAPVVANHSKHPDGHNYEHDDNGSLMNYSGVEDEMNNAQADHEGWEEGYDY